MGAFIQSYESRTMLDSSILIAPLVFFISPNDPRFLATIDKILLPPDRGGLTETGLVFRYNTHLSDDGVGGREGAFSMCTFWLVEALTRAGVYDKKYLVKAVNIFEGMMGFGNHLSMFSEEIARVCVLSLPFSLQSTLFKSSYAVRETKWLTFSTAEW
jgi:GH15 family glucan-1,4-alpha-glucosidase